MLACQDPTERGEEKEEEPTCVGGLVCLMALVDIAWSLVVVVVVVVVMSCRLLPLSLLCNYLPLVYPTYRRCLLLFLFCVPVRNDFWGPIISHPLLFFVPPPSPLTLSFCSFPLLLPLCVCVCVI